MCTTNVSPTAVAGSPVALINMPELSIATWPFGSDTTRKMSAGSAAIARSTSIRSAIGASSHATDRSSMLTSGQSALVLFCAFIACLKERTFASASGPSMSATDLGVSSANGPAAFSHPAGRTPNRFASKAMKMRVLSGPKPGSAISRFDSSSPSEASVQMRLASPSYSSAITWHTACTRLPIDPGNRWIARGPFAITRKASGSVSAIVRASRTPSMRSFNRCGPKNAHSIGTCWSRSMPSSNASGSVLRSSSASGLPVMARSPCMGTDPTAASEHEVLAGGPDGDVADRDAPRLVHGVEDLGRDHRRIDGPVLGAVDVGGSTLEGAGEERHGALHVAVLVLPDDAHGRRRVHHARGQAGAEHAGGAYDSDFDRALRLLAQRVGEHGDRGLRRAVDARACSAGVGVDRRDVHHVAAALAEHLVVHRADAVDDALEVDVDAADPRLVGLRVIGEERERHHARVVHHHIEGAEALDGPGGERLHPARGR